MKNTVKRIFFVATIFTLVFSLLLINAFANVSEEYSSCSDHYFSNLTGDGVPRNEFGSCAYVASAMLLAYYDMYWNDNFVSDIYEQDVAYNSTLNEFGSSTFMTENGTLDAWYTQYISEGGTLNFDQYVNEYYTGFAVADHPWNFLHLDLIKIGINKGYHNSISATEDYGINIFQTAEVLDAYFDSIFGLYQYYDPWHTNDIHGEVPPIKIKVLDSTIPGTSQEEVISKMYELLDNNIPVMYSADKVKKSETDKKSGHIMIAYNAIRDSLNNIIDCELHTGWNNTSHVNLSNTEYKANAGILWFEIDENRIPHVHCDNYVEGNNRYCSCQVYGKLHKEHVHEFGDTVTLTKKDSEEHYAHCIGGCMIPETHIMSHQGNNAAGHLYTCECGYREFRPHTFTYEDVTDATHTARCECGHVLINQEHFYGNYEHYSSIQHKVYCPCGQYMRTETHLIEAINNRYSTCLECGAVFDSWSVPSIKNSEEDEPHERE